MKISQYQIGAITARAFEGNPAAPCPLEGWLDDREPVAGGAITFMEAEIAF